MIRLQKFLADAGVASRRASERIILDGHVTVNGEPVLQLGVRVDPVRDIVKFDGQLLKPKRKLYVALHKPAGYVCTRLDPQGRRTIGELLPREWTDLYSVGRLDYDSEGLILLTNDGEFCLHLTHPRYGIRKRYVVLVEGRVEAGVLRRITKGVVDRGETLRVQEARLISASNRQSQVEVTIAEGRNREVRRLFESQDLKVERLIRIQVGTIRLGELPSGRWRTLNEGELRSLKKALLPMETAGIDRTAR